MPSVQTVAPSTQALTVAEALSHLRESSSANNTLIGNYIKSAELSVEEFARRALIHQTRRMDLPYFCDEMTLDYGKLQSVSSVTYKPSGSTSLSTLAATEYNVDTSGIPGRVLRAKGKAWPATNDETHDAVQITYVVGESSTQSGVPENYRQAERLLVERFYDDRSDYVTGTIVNQLPHGVEALLRPTRNYRFV